MPLQEFTLYLFHLLVWMMFIIVVLAILSVTYLMNQLFRNRRWMGQSVKTTDDGPWKKNVVPRPGLPIQETEQPGIHPSYDLRESIQKLRREMNLALLEEVERRREARSRWPLDYGREGEEHCEDVRDETQASEENQEQALDGHQELLADSSQVLRNTSELSKEKETIQVENGEQLSSVADASPSAEPQLESSNVPGDVDHSQDSASPPEALEVQPSPSDENPSASSSNAAGFSPSAFRNKKKKKKSRQNKKTGSNESLAEAGSSRDEVAAVEDHETSTDGSHHIAIETFSSGFQEQADCKDSKEPSTDRQEAAACQNEKGN